MKKTLAESLNFYNGKDGIIDPNTFAQNLKNIGSEADIDSNGAITKETNLTKDQIKESMNKILQTFVRDKKYESFAEILKTNPDNFSEEVFKEFIKFMNNLPSSKEQDNYYAQYGADAEYMRNADEKIWNKNMSDREQQDWAKRFFEMQNIPPVDVAKQLVKFKLEMMEAGKSNVTMEKLKDIFRQMGYK